MTVTALTGPGRVAQFLWGPNQQNTLTFGYPAALDNAKFWRDPAPGSETGQVNDGQDAWVMSRDYHAVFLARWMTPAFWSDFQRFLDWAAGGGVFTLIPDAVNAPDFGLTGCLLVSPFDDPRPSLEDNGLQQLEISIRNPTYDLGLAWR